MTEALLITFALDIIINYFFDIRVRHIPSVVYFYRKVVRVNNIPLFNFRLEYVTFGQRK